MKEKDEEVEAQQQKQEACVIPAKAGIQHGISVCFFFLDSRLNRE